MALSSNKLVKASLLRENERVTSLGRAIDEHLRESLEFNPKKRPRWYIP